MLAGSLCVATAHSAEIGPDGDLRAAIAALEAGETLELLDGEYVFTSAFRVTAVGTEEAPVVIRAKAGHSPLLNMDTPAQNVMEVRDSRYLEVRGLRLTGGSHGVRLMNSDYVTIADCEIFETGDVAISANSGGTYTGLKILRNHIYHTNGTGEGMYLGCNNDECRVEQSLIEGNYVHHTNRDTVEQGDGIELKEGSSGNIIRHNVVHDTNYPNILVYGTAGNGPANIIEGNVLWNTDAWNLQAAADAVIRNNVILGDVGIQPHQSSVPANIEFVHNTVLFQETPLWVRGVVGPITIANNALYAQSGAAVRLVSGDLSLVTLSGNMGTGGVSGGSGGFTSTNGIDSDLVDASFDRLLRTRTVDDGGLFFRNLDLLGRTKVIQRCFLKAEANFF